MSLLAQLQKPTHELAISEALKESRDKTFKEFLALLEERGQTNWFLELKVSDVIKLKQLTHVPTEEIDDEEAYYEKVLAVITEYGLGTSKRGILSGEIIEQVGGNGHLLRKTLAALKTERKVWSTGKTQGMRWVLWKFKDKAEAEYNRG